MIPYPNSAEVDQTDLYHGVEVADPYRWLEDENSPETAAWVRAQNEVTFDYLRSIPYRERYRQRLTELWNYPRYSGPTRRGARSFFFKNDGLQNQGVLYVQDEPDATPRPLLDPNLLSTDGTVALSNISITDNGRLIAYGISHSGSDWQELRVRDVDTGEDLPDAIAWVKFSIIAWTADNRGFFYSRYPAPDEQTAYSQVHLNHSLYYHRLGTDQSEDLLVHARPDNPDWRLIGEISQDGRYLFIYMQHAGHKNLVHYIDLGDPMNPNLNAPVLPLVDQFEASFGVIGNDGALLYLHTDLDAPKGTVIAVDLEHPQREAWRVLIPESEDVIQHVTLARDRFVVIYLHNAYNRFSLFDTAGGFLNDLQLPTLGSVAGVTGRRDDDEIFYLFTSFLYPTTVFRFNLVSGEHSVYRGGELDFDQSAYETKQVWFTSRDGTRIPMFITHKRGMVLDGTNPTILYGYGGFGTSLTPFFSVNCVLWLEQGGVYAVPNLRGGGEFGEEWHQAGTIHRKQNVFDDFIGAAEYLIGEGYTSPAKLAVQGGSNGGLLVGAVMCQRPELVAVALPAVGVMDMLRYHKFTIGMAWRADYGISDDAEEFRTLHAYSPLHRLAPGTRYPATLVTTADHDDRVVPAHSFKFAARLQKCQAGEAPSLIRIETKAGHGSGKPIAMIIEEAADVLAFAMYNMERASSGKSQPQTPADGILAA